MANYTKKQIDILAEVLQAILDKNTVAKIATVFEPQQGMTQHKGEKNFLPKKDYESRSATGSGWNQVFAQSISLGDGITLRRLRPEHYIVRTKNGEAEFKGLETKGDFDIIWGNAVTKTDDGHNESGIYSALYSYIKDKTLRKIIEKGPTKSKPGKAERLEQAKKKLAEMKIKRTKELDTYIAGKTSKEKTN